MAKIDITTAKNVIESNPRKAYFKIKNTGGPKGATGAQGPQGIPGSDGAQGVPGKAATVTIGSTTTLDPGSSATVTNSGDQYDAVLEFGIPTGAQGPTGATGAQGPRGFQGEKGAKGDTGAAATLTLGYVDTGEPGTNASITNTGDTHNAVYNFTIPRGAKGDKGDSATISVYGTETLEPGSQATVTNVGTSQNVQLQFGIPQGQQGETIEYTAGTGLTLAGTEFSADTTVLATKSDLTPKLETDVVATLPATGTEGKLYLTPKDYTTGTATGNPITIALGEEAGQITSLQLDGDTAQQTYTGKNLFNYQAVTNLALGQTILEAAAYRGYYIAATAGETYTASRKNTTGNNRFRVAFTAIEPANGVNFYGEDGNRGHQTNADSETSVTFTVPEGMTYVFLYLSNEGNDITESLEIQLEKGSPATSYEKFVDGYPVPNPSYPEPIQKVTGEQTIAINGTNYTVSLPAVGDFSQGWTMGQYVGDTWYADSTRATSDWIPVTQGTYTATLVSGTDSTYSFINLSYFDSNKNWLGNRTTLGMPVFAKTDRTKTITLPEGAAYLRMAIRKGANGTDSFTQEEAASQTLDMSYADAIELCKIGTYQDYIYKDGDNWKIHKETKKVVYTGEDNWTTFSGKDRTFYKSVSDITTSDTYSVTDAVISDYYSPAAFITLYNLSVDYGISNHNNQKWIVIRNKDCADVAAFKTWLGAHNTTVYYALATATDTTITDATLIAQLEAVRNATLQASNTITNTATGTNLAGDLELGYCEYNPTNRYDKWIWLDINDNYEQIGS